MGVLAILLIIALVVIYSDHKTIKNLQSQANITTQRDVIREHCTSEDPEVRKLCADDLQKLSDLLGQFSKTLPPAPAK